MSAISSVSSTTTAALAPVTNQDDFGQLLQDFNSVGSALQSGDVSAAQSALSTFQQNLPNTPPFGNNSQANTDYLSLVRSLDSGNLSDAQKAYASLQNDLKSTQTHEGHNHHHHNFSATSSPTSINIATTLPAAETAGGDDGGVLNTTA
jgi:hypothetical protein